MFWNSEGAFLRPKGLHSIHNNQKVQQMSSYTYLSQQSEFAKILVSYQT